MEVELTVYTVEEDELSAEQQQALAEIENIFAEVVTDA